jgi:von Willebrand factor type A domain
VSVTALTPLGALLAIGLVLPLVGLVRIRRRARRVRSTLGVPDPRASRMLLPLGGLIVGGVLLALAATQPVFAWTRDRTVRTDAEAFVVLDVSRSMLAREGLGSPTRLERAKAAAAELRSSLSDVPVGIASLTDRVLPHLFPTSNEDVFAATLQRSIAIERPPPRASFATSATSLNALSTLRGLRYFSPSATARLAIVLTDGESQPVSNARLGSLFRRPPPIEVVFVQVWGKDERVFSRGVPEPQYRSDPNARGTLDRLAASTHGAVYSDDQIEAAARKAHALLGSGPTAVEGEQAGKVPLAPYLAVAALFPFGLLLWRRDR